MSVHRAGICRRNFPERLQAPKVINPEQVELFLLAGQPIYPPSITIGAHSLPVIEWITPVLTIRRKIVRRHAGDDQGLALSIQLEHVGVGPDIGAVVGDKYRDIPKQQYPPFPGIAAHGLPLQVEYKLLKTNLFNGALMPDPESINGL